MKRKSIWISGFVGVLLTGLGALAIAAQDKYTVSVPNGLAFSDFKGYENWQVVAVSQTDSLLKVMVAESHHDRGLPGRSSWQREDFPGRFQDRKNRMEA